MNAAWQGSKKAEGWLGRKNAVAVFRQLAELCEDAADQLDRHSDLGALNILARICVKLENIKDMPCFTGLKQEMAAYKKRASS